MINSMEKKFFFILSLLFFLPVLGFGCKGISQEQQAAIKPITLNYWRVYDDYDSLSEIITAYQALHPNISVNYKKLRPEEFQKELLEALAEDRGPDIFSIHNTWLRAYQSKILPLPPALKVAFQSVEGSYQKELKVDIKNIATPSVKQIQDKFISAVADNVALSGVDVKTNQNSKMIYGLPLAVDTLVLYYNKNLLDQAGIAEPPKTWADFQKDVILLTKIDQENNIVRSGAAFGSFKNVLRAADILSLLMMQNGAPMTSESGFPTFNLTPAGFSGEAAPAEQALRFYTDFAQPTKQVYSWNERMTDSLDAFCRGQAVFFIGYGYQIPLIRARAPKLNFSVANIPQVNLDNPINFASFWVETVSKKTKYTNEAWDFILFATNPKNVVKYLDKTQKTTALRELIPAEKENPEISVSASQLLTAKSWYKGRDAEAAEKYFLEMIDTVFAKETLNDEEVYHKAINTAVTKIGQTM